MSGPSPVVTSGNYVSTLPLTSPVSMPLKNEDGEFGMRTLRPTLSFRQKPEPPKMPSGVFETDDSKPLRPTVSFRHKPEPPKFPDRVSASDGGGRRQEMQKTKSKLDMLSTLIKQQDRKAGSDGSGTLNIKGGSGSGVLNVNSSSDEDSSDDEAIPIPQSRATRVLIRPGAPPPPPPGLAGAASQDLPPLPKVMIKPQAPPQAPPAPAPPPAVITKPDENAPENWTPMWSPEENRNYYYNKVTGASTWENPNLLPSPTSLVPPSSTIAAVPTRVGNGSSNTFKAGSELERQVHKKTIEGPNNDDDVDIFGRSSSGRGGSGGSGGSNSSGRMSLRATLSRALGLGANPKKPASPLRGSDSSSSQGTGSDSHRAVINPSSDPHQSVINPVNDPHRSVINPASFPPVAPPPVTDDRDDKSESGRSERSQTLGEKIAVDKHVQVVAEVRTKAGRHTIVRAKKPKKKDHSIPANVTSHHMAGTAPEVLGVTNHHMAGTAPEVLGPDQSGGVSPVPLYGAPQPQQMVPMAAYQQSFYAQAPPPIPQHTVVHFAPPQQPVAIRYVQALYDFVPSDPTNDSEISLMRGDFIQLIEQGPDGWWEGIHSTTGQRGLFPGSHVQFVS